MTLMVRVDGNAADGSLSDIHCFDTDTESWSEVEVAEDSPEGPALFFHSANLVGDQLLVWGGKCEALVGVIVEPDLPEVLRRHDRQSELQQRPVQVRF